MKEYHETGNITASARKAGMDRGTARKYIRKGEAPGERSRPRDWRTRRDPFTEVWPEVEGWLHNNPQMEGTSAFEELLRLYPDQFAEGQLRSLQRRFREWKQANGHGRQKPVFFEQEHMPGKLLEVDWFYPRDFVVTICGQEYQHRICHSVLTYSNWEWAIPCRSESFLSLKSCLQATVQELGACPEICQVDNSSTATHHLGKGSGRRTFNERFLGVLAHYGMQAKTIQVGAANENGDVESSHSHLRRYLVDQLKLRPRGADFDSVEAYREWLQECLRRRNQRRVKALEEEKVRMKPLPPCSLPEYEESECIVNKYSIARVGKNGYSVAPVYRGQRLRAHVYENHIELWHSNTLVARVDDVSTCGRTVVNWRHLIEELCRKPGAFERYRHRESFYPSPVWKQLGASLRKRFRTVRADSDYLQILRLSLEHGLGQIEELVERLGMETVTLDQVRADLREQDNWRNACAEETLEADLSVYDQLLSQEEVSHG